MDQVTCLDPVYYEAICGRLHRHIWVLCLVILSLSFLASLIVPHIRNSHPYKVAKLFLCIAAQGRSQHKVPAKAASYSLWMGE